MNRKLKVMFALAILCFLTLGCIGQEEEEPEEVTKIAIVFATGGLGDKSFNDTCYEGVREAETDFGIKFDYVEPTAIAEYEGFHRQYAMTGEYALIIGIGFDQADAITVVAGEYPDQNFAIVDMVVDQPNVASLVFNENEGSFLVGAAAALKTQTNKIGFVGGMDIPLIRKFLAGYKYGAEHINPNIQVMWKYVGDWADPAKGKELALAQFDDGADVVYAAAGRSGLGAIQAAHERGMLVIGVDADQCDTIEGVPVSTFLASMLKRVDVAVYDMIKAVVEGTFTGGVKVFGAAQNGVGICKHVPSDIKGQIDDLMAEIASGEITVPIDIDESGQYVWG